MQLAHFFILDEIVRPRVGRQPVLVLKILAKGLEHRERQFRSVPGNLADKFSVAFYDRKVAIVHPYGPFEKAALSAQLFRPYLKNVRIELVELVLPRVCERVIRNFLGRYNEKWKL